jgi:hypothetical protein
LRFFEPEFKSLNQVPMFARLTALPFLFFTLIFLYLAWTVDSSYAPWMVPFLIIAAVIYILSPQINWWWYSRRPPRLDVSMRQTLERVCTFYNRLPEEGKIRFEGRVALFRMGTDWTALDWPEDDLPPDVELALATQAVILTFSRDEFLFKKFEKVIVYPRPFPSPEHPYFHSSELYEPDGCLIFSAENLMLGFYRPAENYNTGMHEYAKAFVNWFPDAGWPVVQETEFWEKMTETSGMDREKVEKTVGLAGLDPVPVAIHHYFNFPEDFRRQDAELFSHFERIFAVKS